MNVDHAARSVLQDLQDEIHSLRDFCARMMVELDDARTKTAEIRGHAEAILREQASP